MDPLVARLTPIAEKVRRIGNRVVRIEERYLQRRQPKADADQHALVAVFEAFIGMGGNVESPDAFAWEEHHDELVKEGLRRFTETYQGPKSAVGDFKMRQAPRRIRASADTRAWTIWQGLGQRHTEYGHAPRRHDQHEWDGGVDEQIVNDAHVAQVLAVMQRELTPREYEWVVARYLYNVNITALVDDLGQRDPYYTGPDGRRRAEAVINTAVSRARRKLRRVLAPEGACA